MTKLNAIITGVGGYVPDYILDNHELSTMVETSDEWITTRVGIKERRILKEEGKGASLLGANATRELLEKTNTNPEDVDLLICATVTPDHMFPSTAVLITHELGMKNAFAYDLSAACSGFLYALETGNKFIQSGQYKKVVVVGAEKMSSIINYEDRNTCALFGDGAAAVMLEPTEEDFGILDASLHCDGVGKDLLVQKSGGSAYPLNEERLANKENCVYQEGKHVYKYAVTNMSQVSVNMMERNNIASEELAYLIPHQANLRIIEAVGKRMGLEKEQVLVNIEKYGNTTAATIPLVMYDFEKNLKKGDKIILTAFGGGFTWGAMYLKWAYNS